MLTRESLIAAACPKTRTVDIPEWGETVLIRELKAEYASELARLAKDDGQFAKMAIYSLVDESGTALFQDTAEDKAIILGFGMGGLLRLVQAINELNGINIAQAAKN